MWKWPSYHDFRLTDVIEYFDWCNILHKLLNWSISDRCYMFISHHRSTVWINFEFNSWTYFLKLLTDDWLMVYKKKAATNMTASLKKTSTWRSVTVAAVASDHAYQWSLYLTRSHVWKIYCTMVLTIALDSGDRFCLTASVAFLENNEHPRLQVATCHRHQVFIPVASTARSP